MEIININVENAYEEYKKGKSGKEIAQDLNISYATLLNKFKEKNLRIYNSKKYMLDHRYFEKIDTEAKAYFLGLIYSDGCIYKNRLVVALQEVDKEILEKFKDELNYTGKLYYRKYKKAKNQWSLEVSSKYLIKNLKELGLMENKSNKLDHLPDINFHFYKHFIRGYVDGDGSIGIDKRSNAPTFTIIGNKEFLFKIREVLDKLDVFRGGDIITETSCTGKFELFYKTKRSFVELYNLLYKDCNIYLKRKRQKFKKVLSQINYNSNRNKKVKQLTLEGEEIKIWNHMNEIKEALNLKSVDKIYKCMRGVSKSSMGYKWEAIEYECK